MAELVQGQYDAGGHYPLNDERREDPMCAWLMQPDPKIAAALHAHRSGLGGRTQPRAAQVRAARHRVLDPGVDVRTVTIRRRNE